MVSQCRSLLPEHFHGRPPPLNPAFGRLSRGEWRPDEPPYPSPTRRHDHFPVSGMGAASSREPSGGGGGGTAMARATNLDSAGAVTKCKGNSRRLIRICVNGNETDLFTAALRS